MEKNKTIAEIIFGEKPKDYIHLFNKNKKYIYYEDNNTCWNISLFNNQNEQIYFENSLGIIKDNRPIPNKTIAEIIFGKKPKDYIHFFDNNKNKIYYEYNDGYWRKSLYINKNQEIYVENSLGIINDKRPKPNKTIAEIIFGEKPEIYIFLYNQNKKYIYYEDRDNYWDRKLYNNQNQQIYFETSDGFIIDNKPKIKPKLKSFFRSIFNLFK